MVMITGKNGSSGGESGNPDINDAKKKIKAAENIKDPGQSLVINDPADKVPEEPKKDKIGKVLEKLEKNKRFRTMKAFVIEEKQQLVQTGCIALGLIIVLAAASIVSFSKTGILKGQLSQLNSAYNSLNNDIDVFKKTNSYYTKVESSVINIQNVNWLPVHAKADMAKVSADKQAFWDWISQAFDSEGLQHPDVRNSTGGRGWIDARYDEPSEEMYNEVMQRIAKEQNLTMDNLFFTSFMSYSEYVGTQADYYKAFTYLIGSTDSGDYHYMALVPMCTSKRNPVYTMIGFSFTVKHTTAADNSDIATITDFNVWPPDNQNRLLIGR